MRPNDAALGLANAEARPQQPHTCGATDRRPTAGRRSHNGTSARAERVRRSPGGAGSVAAAAAEGRWTSVCVACKLSGLLLLLCMRRRNLRSAARSRSRPEVRRQLLGARSLGWPSLAPLSARPLVRLAALLFPTERLGAGRPAAASAAAATTQPATTRSQIAPNWCLAGAEFACSAERREMAATTSDERQATSEARHALEADRLAAPNCAPLPRRDLAPPPPQAQPSVDAPPVSRCARARRWALLCVLHVRCAQYVPRPSDTVEHDH